VLSFATVKNGVDFRTHVSTRLPIRDRVRVRVRVRVRSGDSGVK